MRCCKNLLSAIVFCVLLVASLAQAADISVRSPQITVNEDGYSVAADFNINFNTRLEEAVNKGVVLYFAVEFELSRSRWYWFDEQIVRRSKTFQLSYHALTRQYRLSTGALHQSYATLDDALGVMSHVRNWQVLEKGQVKADRDYLAGLRMHLDLTQMAKTFQVSALANRDWNLASDWLRWNFLPADAARAVTLPPAPVALPAAVPPGPAAAPAATPPAASGEPTTPASGEPK